jgi:hypothetical protein
MGPDLRRGDANMPRSRVPMSDSCLQIGLRDLAARHARALPENLVALIEEGAEECRVLDAPAAWWALRSLHASSRSRGWLALRSRSRPTLPRPPHPTPTFVTIAKRPSCEAEYAGVNHKFLKNRSKISSGLGLDEQITLNCLTKFDFARTWFLRLASLVAGQQSTRLNTSARSNHRVSRANA